MRSCCPYFVLLTMLFGPASFAENWPCWRGPQSDGTSTETDVPIEWDGETGKNIAWKVEIPGAGHSSPVIWEDRIILLSCLEDTKDRVLICLDRLTGETLWQKTVVTSALETMHRLNTRASGTPATDGQTIYATFMVADGHEVPAPNVGTARPVTPGEIMVVAYDWDGTKKWSTMAGPFTSAHGFCTSPVIHEDLVIINGDHDGDSYVAALDRTTGKEAWKISRDHGIRSYSTPIIRDIAGKTQMVMSGSSHIISLDPNTGREYWRIEGPAEQFVASMVCDGQKFYMSAGYPTHHVMAIRPDGSGDVTESHVEWHTKKAKSYVPSPVLVGKRLFVADDRGTANCFDTDTGERIWRDRLGRHFNASLIAANGFVYFFADDGIAKVIRAGDSLDVVHKNPLGEYVSSSPAISGGQLFVRGEKHLYAIGKPTIAAIEAENR